MTFDQILKLIIENGAAVGLAVFSITQLQKSYAERMADLKEQVQRRQEDFTRLENLHRETVQALKDNTAALVTLAERRFSRRDDATPTDSRP